MWQCIDNINLALPMLFTEYVTKTNKARGSTLKLLMILRSKPIKNVWIALKVESNYKRR